MPPNFGNTNFKVWRQSTCCYAVAGLFLLLPIVPALAQAEDCNFLTSPQNFNTVEGEDETTVIGQVKKHSYIVLLSRDLQENLPPIRACIPDAFLTSSRLGSYIHIASFDDYREARDLGKHISENLNIRVRVIHVNRLRP